MQNTLPYHDDEDIMIWKCTVFYIIELLLCVFSGQVYWLILLISISEVIVSTMVSQITGVSIVYSTVCSGTDQ